MTDDPAELGRTITQRCLDLGFAAAGVAPVEPTRWAEHWARWLAEGRGGTMDYLARDLALRFDPSIILPGVRAIVVVADQYEKRGRANDRPIPAGHGRIARYAQGADYHATIKPRLYELSDRLREEFPGSEFKSFADTVPVLEREHAERAGLGWVGKNTMLISPKLGSYFVLGGVLTTLELRAPAEQGRVPDFCGTCTRCIDACPTRAITPYSVDASRCISYLTIEREKLIPEEFHEKLGEWIFGCDVCQDVCPHNSARPAEVGVGEPNPAYASRRNSFDLMELLAWTEEDRQRELAGSAMKRASLAMMKRNAMLVAARTLPKGQLSALAERLRTIRADRNEPELVRFSARQADAMIRARSAE